MFTRNFPGVLLALAMAWPAGAAAPEIRQDPEQIRASAERFVRALAPPGAHVEATAARLDPRLNLVACAEVLTPTVPAGAELRPRIAVTVHCDSPGGWSIVVPVEVETELAVLVARRPLNRGEMPAAGELASEVRTVPGLGTQYVQRLADIADRRLRHPVAAGQPLIADALAAPVLVERNQQVTLVAQMQGIAVRTGAVALDAGGRGDRVRARNAASGRIIEGVVQADGTVATGP